MPADEGEGLLLVVATPIGNLGDLSPRAAEALREADLVLAEDTRHTGRLLAHIGATTPQLSYHEHNERERAGAIVARIAAGERIALVTDAGTPAVSDPGYRLVNACAAAGLRVEAVPGPSAALHALVVSGLATDRFTFEGFLPRKGRARHQRLADLATEPRTMVLFVSPHRAGADLADLAAALGASRPAVLCRELTKLHEETRRGDLATLAEGAADVRGEVTVVIAGAPELVPVELTPAQLAGEVAARTTSEVTKKQAIAALAREQGVPKRVVYQAVVDGES